MRKILLFALSVCILIGCSNTAPTLIRVDYEVMTIFDGSDVKETVNLFIACNDENGFDDILEVQILEEGSELAWVLDGDAFSQDLQGNLNWIAAMSLDFLDIDITRGVKLKIRVVDYAGMQDNRTIHVSAPPVNEDMFPYLEKSRGYIYISSRLFPVYLQSFDDVNDEYFVMETMQKRLSVEELVNQGYNMRYGLYASVFDQQTRRYYRFGPFSLKLPRSLGF